MTVSSFALLEGSVYVLALCIRVWTYLLPSFAVVLCVFATVFLDVVNSALLFAPEKKLSVHSHQTITITLLVMVICVQRPRPLASEIHSIQQKAMPVVYSTDRSKAVAPVLVLLFVALWFILRGDLF